METGFAVDLRVISELFKSYFSLGAQIYTPVAALQGEIGASSVEGRDMKMKLKFANTANGLLAVIFGKLTSEALYGKLESGSP